MGLVIFIVLSLLLYVYCIGIIAIADAESYNTFELGSGKLIIAP